METYEAQFGAKFQTHILSVLVRDPGFAMRYRTAVSHEYFIDDSHRLIAKTFLAHIDKHRCLPTRPTLEVEVKVGAPKDDHEVPLAKLGDLYEHDISDARAVMEKAVEFGQHQALVNAIITCAEDLEKGRAEALDSTIRKAQMVGMDLLDIGTRFTDDSRFAYYTDPAAAIQRIPTGIPHLDFAMDGGLGRGELGVILAPPKRGKSTALVNFGYGAACAGFNVAHYSLEMDKETVLERYDDRLMGSAVSMKRTDPEEYVKLLKERVVTTVSGGLFVQRYFTRRASVSTIRSHLSLLVAEGFKPDLVIVDYADILRAERRLGDMRHEQAGIYEDLRELAGEFDVAQWTASQTSKGALEREVVTIADFAESFEKAAIADAVWAFCQSDAEKIDQVCRLFGAALRKSEDGRTVECSINRKTCLLRSTALYDSAYTKITMPSEVDGDKETAQSQAQEEADPVVKSAATSRRRRVVSALKAEAGIGENKRRPSLKEKASGSKRRVGVPAKAASSTDPAIASRRRRPSKPSKVVGG